ncbi:hypothetical protein ASPWEDRAFT_31408 [Aspergillus wentii DTO 134E9]|uniref:Fucose-specific lectin n=1 Tax=Aspergillus wentii DTO 134E9 TaxID=1073089 RepID=A0A1L9RC65_ASPWE|nr:uncharacterized protein ASPWEDRAFT_31408 [Aspergillus wentii DTO 134E9]OJJ32515.1 hypothetical protein ASPWEDRAFT_31408 [Aspergillus wentii DTO 134E9]
MSGSVAVLANPANADCHQLYTVENGQIALELRDVDQKNIYSNYQGNSTQKGYIWEAGSFAGIIQNSIPVVYGTTTTTDSKNVISRLSPYYNPIVDPDGKPIATDHKALAACSVPGKQDYFVYFFQRSTASDPYVLQELHLNPSGLKKNNADQATIKSYKAVTPATNSNLAALAFYYHYIFWGDDQIYYLSTRTPNAPLFLDGTGNIGDASPLTVNSYTSKKVTGETVLRFTVYYVDRKHRLCSVTGEIDRNGTLGKTEAGVVEGADEVADWSLLTVANKDDTNYVYYVPNDNSGVYKATLDQPWTKGSASS